MAYTAKNLRYKRQTSLKEFGDIGQQKLHYSKILVIGAGGLGCPALRYLAGAGIGTLGIADHDTVSLSNLHRQILYSTDDVGLSKATRASELLEAFNPEIEIIPFNQYLNPENALSVISQFDVILDGTDNFASRYMINDACVLLDKPLVYGAISRFEGQVAIFNSRAGDAIPVNYRDLFPSPPPENEIQNCAEAGVLGVLAGIIGTMMANEAIKLITGIGKPLINKLLTYNSLNNQIYELEVQPKAETRTLIPATATKFEKTNYEWLCSDQSEQQIDVTSFNNLLNNSSAVFVDVRELNETPVINEFKHIQLPLSELMNDLTEINGDIVVLFCQSGKRSLSAAKMLSEHYGDSKKVYSLQNGIVNWKN